MLNKELTWSSQSLVYEATNSDGHTVEVVKVKKKVVIYKISMSYVKKKYNERFLFLYLSSSHQLYQFVNHTFLWNMFLYGTCFSMSAPSKIRLLLQLFCSFCLLFLFQHVYLFSFWKVFLTPYNTRLSSTYAQRNWRLYRQLGHCNARCMPIYHTAILHL